MRRQGSSDFETVSDAPGGIRVALHEALFILISSVLLAFAYTAVTQKGIFSRSPDHVVSKDQVRSPEVVTVEQARVLHSSGKVLFIDTREESSYRTGHIQGAVNVPLPELEAELIFLKEISSEKILVPYCDGSSCHSSLEFSNRLLAEGISNIKVFFGGWEEWTAARLPMASH